MDGKNNANNTPTVFVILGATGDLMSRKIAPALFNLFMGGKLPDKFQVVGFARRALSNDEFRNRIAASLKENSVFKKRKANEFLKNFSYMQGHFEDEGTYMDVKKFIERINDEWGVCSNKLFYLAVPPEFYEVIAKNLSSSNLAEACSPEEGWTRVLLEKPFGKNADTAQKIDEFLGRLFDEKQIYRIDHYLGKEMLQNILSFRFSNTLFENIWHGEFIDSIKIRLLEKIDVGGRGAFYDSVGALRDVGQNHLLQMLALVTMEHPASFGSEAIRKKRGDLLSALTPMTRDEIAKQTYRAQYEGYKETDGVRPDSRTETYFKIRGNFLSSERWKDVPIEMEAGKHMEETRKEIIVTFKHPEPCLCPNGATHFKNRVIFSLEPNESITVQFWSKKPGLDFDVEERDLLFLLRKKRKTVRYVEEYEKLLLDCISGDQTLFVTTDEVRSMWRFVDAITDAWEESTEDIPRY